MSRRSRRRFALIVVPVALEVLGCRSSESVKPVPVASTATVFSVDPVPVVAREVDLLTSLPGELTPFDAVEIFPRVSGFVRRLAVDRGSAVHAGSVLFELDAPELRSQRAEAEAKVAADKSTRDRLEAAQKQTPGAVAEHDVELANAALAASTAKMQSLRTLESYLVVTAPFDGVITERSISLGALVGPPSGGRGAPLLKMESVAKLRLTVAVPEDETSALALGESIEFGVRAWPGRRFKGKLVRLARAVDARTRTMPVELDVDNADGALASGMYATVAWRVRRTQPSLFVPESAIVQGTEKTFVVRLKDGKADPVAVVRGLAIGGLAEVFGDLRVGDVVAKRGSEELKAGSAVVERPASSAISIRTPSTAPKP